MGRELFQGGMAIPLGSDDAADFVPPREFPIFKVGENPTKKGPLHYDAESAASVLKEYEQHGIADLVIDYEHQTMADPPVRAPAAGWFKPQARPDGLWATDVRWNPPALEHLKNREYRFFSPVAHYDTETRRVTSLLNVALTNFPAMRGIQPLVAAKETQPREERMISVLKALGLKDDAGEAEALSATVQLNDFKREILTLTERQTLAEAVGEIAAMKQAREQVVALGAKVAELEGAAREREIVAMVEGAMKAGKISPAMKQWALDLGKKPDGAVSLKTFVEAAPVLAQPEVKTPPTKSEISVIELTADDKAVAEAMGIEPEKLATFKAERAKRRTKAVTQTEGA